MNEKQRKAAIIVASILGCGALFYLGGLLGQVFTNYTIWMESGGMWGQTQIAAPDWNPAVCLLNAFSWNGVKAIFLIVVIGAGIVIYVKVHEKFSQNQYDDRGFTKSKAGTYGTADWMTEKELKSVLELSTPERATGMILGERKGQLVCLPENTRLNRHCAIFGASGTMKSRAVIRNALFSIIRRGESALIADPKSEMYSDTSELFRKNGYEVKVLNLVDPLHGDSWNCMSDLNGNTMMAQVLTNVIIGNTSNGKSDHFWDNGEANLLKALVLYTDLDKTLPPERKNLAYVYQLLTHNSEKTLTIMFEKLPPDHPARAPFNLFSQSSDTVKSGIILGLGTRLQVLQNEAVKQLVSFSDIDLTAPGSHKCAYYIILSDQETSMAFLSSLFFSFLFIKLTRFADLSPGGRCPVPVNLILDEFNNIGRIGGAPDGSDFCRSLSVIRSRDIRVMLAVQSLGQLQNRYPNNLWSEIIGNCDIQLMLGCTDDVTADYISDRSGEMCIVVDSTMTVKKTVAVTQVIPQYRETQGQGKRKLLTPDEVLRLPHEQMLVIIRGQNLLLLNKFDYTRHPMSKEMVRASIMDYCPRTSYAPTHPRPVLKMSRTKSHNGSHAAGNSVALIRHPSSFNLSKGGKPMSTTENSLPPDDMPVTPNSEPSQTDSVLKVPPRHQASTGEIAGNPEGSNEAPHSTISPRQARQRLNVPMPNMEVLAIDDALGIQTEIDKARDKFLDLVESLKTGRYLTDKIQGVEKHSGLGEPRAVIFHGDYKVIIMASMIVDLPKDLRGQDPYEVYHYLLTKRLGSEIDYVVKGIDRNTGLAVGSRKDAMATKRRHYYLNQTRDGTYRIYEGLCCEARVMSVIPYGIFVDLFGIDVYIPLRELSYVRLTDAMGYYEPGDRVLVKVTQLNRDDPDDIRVAASVKQVAANPVDKALEKIEVNSNYAGTVTLTDSTGIFVRLDMGAECRCRFPYRARPPKGARVVVKIAGVDMEQKTVWGNITYVTIPK